MLPTSQLNISGANNSKSTAQRQGKRSASFDIKKQEEPVMGILKIKIKTS